MSEVATAINGRDVAECRRQAAFYRARGYNPLPSRMDAKRPMLSYADLWETPLPAAEFDRFETSNVQVMTGRHWGLLVIDLDGPEAIERWAGMGATPRTWVSHSGGGGRHVWLSIPRDGRPLPKAVLWKGDGDHEAIERLCDKSLVAAPPSIHPKTGRRYLWLDKWNSPYTLGKPAACPDWVLRLAPVVDGRAKSPRVVHGCWRGRASKPVGGWPADVRRLVESWGVRTVGNPRQSGWLECHAFGRDDECPSAAIHVDTGVYVDSGTGEKMSIYGLAVAVGAFSTREEAFKELGSR